MNNHDTKTQDNMKKSTFLFIILFFMAIHGYPAKQTNGTDYEKYIGWIADKKYEKCFKAATKAIEKAPGDANYLLLKSISLSYLPGKHDFKSSPDWIFQMLDWIASSKSKQIQPDKQYLKFYSKKLKRIQDKIFREAVEFMDEGNQEMADKVLDKMYQAFHEKEGVYQNHYGSTDEEYMLKILIGEYSYEGLKENKEQLHEEARYYFDNQGFKEWNHPKYRLADAARDVSVYNEEEKRVFYYLNLMKMNPGLFFDTYVNAYLMSKYAYRAEHSELKFTSFDLYQKLELPFFKYLEEDHYYATLMEDFMKLEAKTILVHSDRLYQSADCWAKESGEKGIVGHKRVNCKSSFSGECCDYGPKIAMFIIFDLLIDRGVESLGHRHILMAGYKSMGIAIRPHSVWGNTAVLDFGYY